MPHHHNLSHPAPQRRAPCETTVREMCASCPAPLAQRWRCPWPACWRLPASTLPRNLHTHACTHMALPTVTPGAIMLVPSVEELALGMVANRKEEPRMAASSKGMEEEDRRGCVRLWHRLHSEQCSGHAANLQSSRRMRSRWRHCAQSCHCLSISHGRDRKLQEPSSNSPPTNWPSMLAAAWAGLSAPT